MRGAAVFCLALAACGPALPPEPSVQLAPDAQGIEIRPTGLRIDFGRSPGGVETTLDRELGPHQDMGLQGCPTQIAEQMRWADLILAFTDERFVGWRQGDAAQGLVCNS